MTIDRSLVREPASDAEGIFFLLHGRGADERDLLPLLDLLDPDRRLIGITPRGPLHLPPGGAHWYVIRQLGYPDPTTFHETLTQLREWMNRQCEAYGVGWERCLLGGFSQGAVMAYALGCEQGHPPPSGLVCFSGFIPTVDGFSLRGDLSGLPVAIGHGTLDNVIGVEWSRQARVLLESKGAEVLYKEYHLTHAIDPAFAEEVRIWLGNLLDLGGAHGV